jgi:shikimate dehydrogenase
MHPLDVLPEDVNAVMTALRDEPRYRGGAVTTPHKETIARWLGEARLTPEANRIGAVNCIFRSVDGNLHGTNTDGEGALTCFAAEHGTVEGKNVLQLGCGGAGKAVASYFSAAGAKVTLMVRDVSKVSGFASSISADVAGWETFDRLGPRQNILINATDVGFSGTGKRDRAPLTRDQIASLKPGTTIYDLIYDPSPTLLLSMASDRGLAVMDGTRMNLEQAVLGFGYCFPAVGNREQVREIMSLEKKRRGW